MSMTYPLDMNLMGVSINDQKSKVSDTHTHTKRDRTLVNRHSDKQTHSE